MMNAAIVLVPAVHEIAIAAQLAIAARAAAKPDSNALTDHPALDSGTKRMAIGTRDPCTFRLGCHAPLCLTDAERPPAEEIMSIGGAHGARRGTGPTYLDCPLSRGVLYLILQNRISRGIRIAGNKAASSRSLTSAAGCLRLPLPKTRGIERAARPLSNGR